MAIGSGYSHSLAVRNDGTAWAWGSNFTGQLGIGNTTDTTLPVRVSGLSNVVAVAGGGAHSLAVKSDGTVWAWGYSFYGQLGNGGNADSLLPVRVAGLGNVVAVAGGDHYSMALKSDGMVWAWGRNDEGELGNGTNYQSSVPTLVSGLSGVVAIGAAPVQGLGHSVALKADGTVWAWGYNSHGQLGNGAESNSNVPVQVSGIRGAIAVSAGGRHSLALLAGSGSTERAASPATTPAR